MRSINHMSRLGKQPVIVPNGVEMKVVEKQVVVKGPKGELMIAIHRKVHFEENPPGTWKITVDNEADKTQRALWGLYKRLVENMITGVTQGFSKKLELNGVGYKVQIQGKKLMLNVGYSHPVEFPLPEGISAEVNANEITILGIDKQLVGEVAAQVRKIRKPEPYKGKGIKYSDEVIRRKAGKSTKTA